MPYNTTTLGLNDISAKTWADWIWEAQDSTWGDSGLSNVAENTSGGMGIMNWMLNNDIDRVVYEWGSVLNPNKNNTEIKDLGVVSVESVEIKQDVEMSEDDLMELLEM